MATCSKKLPTAAFGYVEGLRGLASSPWVQILVATAAIVTAAFAIYRPILLNGEGIGLYPWASDTLGHLLKAEFMAEELQSGNFYPQIFPHWYSGVQLLRYFPPVPYYLLAGAYLVTGDIVFAAGAFVFAAALFGGLSFLLYRRWFGLFPATVAGILFMALPDNIRVALAEGNLLRVMATAWLPLAFYVLLSILTRGPTKTRFALLTILTMLMVLSHAMMGAIFVACLTLTTIVFWFVGHAHREAVGASLAAIFGGVLLSGWWLLPSLTGGITELNTEAAGEALVSFPLTVSLDPFVRYQNKEVYYLGMSLVGGAILALIAWRRLNRNTRSLIVAAVPVLLVSSTVFNPVYRTVPLHELMWPIRFMSFAGFILLVGMMACAAQLLRGSWKAQILAVGLTAALVVDVVPSLPLVFLRPPSDELVTVAERVQEMPGWRVATADFSRLGSRASYRFATTGEREQVYGWAYQGSQIAPLLASINFAMEKGYSPYAVDRLEELGADYVVRLKGIPIDPSFDALLEERGYMPAEETQSLTLYHRQGGPRGYKSQYLALGVGEGARSLALLFPNVAVGASPVVDDYSLDDLKEFPTLFLSGFSWRQKADAERLVREYVKQGGQAVVDLTGVPEELLSKRPRFLGVYGEPVSLYSPPSLHRGDQDLALRSFDSRYSPWTTLSPQGLDGSTVTFRYLGQEATALGFRRVEGGQVWFLGLNLPFHSMLTKDAIGIALLEEILELTAGALPQRDEVPLTEYRAGSDGYSFRYTLAQNSSLMVPIARHDGTFVAIDGQEVDLLPIGSLTHFRAPEGTHDVRVGFRPTSIYKLGLGVTTGVMLIILGTLFGPHRSTLRFARRKQAMMRAHPRGEAIQQRIRSCLWMVMREKTP